MEGSSERNVRKFLAFLFSSHHHHHHRHNIFPYSTAYFLFCARLSAERHFFGCRCWKFLTSLTITSFVTMIACVFLQQQKNVQEVWSLLTRNKACLFNFYFRSKYLDDLSLECLWLLRYLLLRPKKFHSNENGTHS